MREHRAIHADARSGAGDLDDGADRLQVRNGRSSRFRRYVLVAEAADFVDEILQVRLLVHAPPHSWLTHTQRHQ